MGLQVYGLGNYQLNWGSAPLGERVMKQPKSKQELRSRGKPFSFLLGIDSVMTRSWSACCGKSRRAVHAVRWGARIIADHARDWNRLEIRNRGIEISGGPK
jgi:hypothetical protein